MNRLPGQRKSKGKVTEPIHRLGQDLQRIGWVGFWIQVVFAFLSLIIILTVFFGRNFNASQIQAPNRSNFGLILACIGLIFLSIGIYCNFRYPQLGRQLDNPEKRPSKAEVLKYLKLGLWVNVLGMVFTVIAAEWNVGMLLLRVLSLPQGAAVYATGLLVEPIDIFVVQSKINIIAAQLTGIISALWLLLRVNHNQP